MSTVIENPNEALLSLRDTGPTSLVERIDGFIGSMAEVVKQSESLVPAAEEMVVDSEASFQFCDEMRVELEMAAKGLDAQRMNLTRPIDDLKAFVMSQVKPAIDNNKAAAQIYNRKALTYRAEQRAIAQAAQREAERIQRETQARLEEEARKREVAAAKLKSEAGRKKAMEEAEALRQAAVHTPVTMAVSAPAPQATASNVVEKWLWEIGDLPAFCRWLGAHPEWLSERGTNNCVMGPKIAAMNKMVNHYADSLEIPGVRVWPEESFRKKASR